MMDPTGWVSSVDEHIASRPTPADRSWAWCWVIRQLALRDLLEAPPGTTTDAVWVEPGGRPDPEVKLRGMAVTVTPCPRAARAVRGSCGGPVGAVDERRRHDPDAVG